MKGSVTVTNFKKCTCFVLMLLFISMLTMSIGTTYILCIRWKVSITCTNDYLGNCAMKHVGHHVTSQEFAPTQKWKEILKVVMSPLVYTPKWISKNQVNQNDVPCVAFPPLCRLRPTTLILCHIVCILKFLLYYFKFKYFVLLFVISYLFCNLNILVQVNLSVKYIFFNFN